MTATTITGFKWVPRFAQGQVRDHRLRWMLHEIGRAYDVRLLDAKDQQSAAYRAEQPFGQVPVLQEAGRPTLFESGAIVLELALRSGRLLPHDEDERGQVLGWYFAALNSVEPSLISFASVAFFERDKELRERRRPAVEAFARQRLAELERGLGGRDHAVGEAFTIADLMLASVLKIAASLGVLDDYAQLVAFQARHFERPAYRRAMEEQCTELAAHSAADMKYPAS